MKRMITSRHARTRANERQIDKTVFRAASREAERTNLQENLETQHRNFSAMLNEKIIHARVGRVEYTATNYEIKTKLDVNGVTIAVGIKREGEGYSPLTVTTVWN